MSLWTSRTKKFSLDSQLTNNSEDPRMSQEAEERLYLHRLLRYTQLKSPSSMYTPQK
jgi:hypothetical protein